MPHESSRNGHARIGRASASQEIGYASAHKKAMMDQPRLDQSSNTYTEIPTPITSSPKRGGENACRSTSRDDDADADVSDADADEPDDESEEDGEGDAFAPSDRAINEHGDQAGLITKEGLGLASTFDEKQGKDPSTFEDQSKTTKAKLFGSDSDDEIYNGVDLISDFEEDELSVEQLEERNIIGSEQAPANVVAGNDWEGFGFDDSLFLVEDAPFFDEQYGRTDSNILGSENELFQSRSIFDGVPSPSPSSPCAGRVHFKEGILPSSNVSDMDSNIGDIDILFRNNSTLAVPPSGNLDLGDTCQGHEDDNGSTVGKSSGYETDYSDTTVQEDAPASATKRPQSLLRQPSLLSSLVPDAPIPATSRTKYSSSFPRNAVGQPRGPRISTWTVDSTKTCAFTDSTGEKIVITPPRRPTRTNKSSVSIANNASSTGNASTAVSQQTLVAAPEYEGNDPGALPTQAPMYEYHDPVLGPGSDLVTASAPLAAERSRQSSMSHPNGAPSVFFPLDPSSDVDYIFEDDYLNDDDAGEDDLNIGDFIDWGDDSSEGGDQAADDDSALTSPIVAQGSGPVQLKTPSSANVMKHLDRRLVSAFRRGQPHHQPQSRFRHNNSALNPYALNSGRQASVNAQMGPLKKRRLSGSCGRRPSFGAPLAKRRMLNHR